MTRSMQEMGGRLIEEGETILRRDARNALDEQDYNMTVRRAQEAVELVLKGALKMLGVDYPRVHNPAPVFSEQVKQKLEAVEPETLDRIEEVSLWLSQARAPSFYFERDYGEEDAQQAYRDASFVVEETKKIVDSIQPPNSPTSSGP